MKKQKKRKIRKGRLALLLAFLVAIIIGLSYGVYALVSLFYGDDSGNAAQQETVLMPEVSKEMLARDSVMAQRLDSMIHIPQRLDTSKIAISVFDVTTRRKVFSFHADESLIPASCMKISTAIAALKSLGMNHLYHTHILAMGEMRRDTLVGNLLLQADDDPLLESFDSLIDMMKRKGVRHVRGNVYVNLEREDTLRPHPSAKAWDIPYHKTPLLLRGKRYVERSFHTSLRMKGVTVRRDATVKARLSEGSLGGGRYHFLATVSHPLRDVITPMLIHSSNIKADAVFYHLDRKKGLMPERRMQWDVRHHAESFWQQQSLFPDSIMQLYAFRDGSGLSPLNRLSANALVQMLLFAYDDKPLRDYLIDEALASTATTERRGSLLTRMMHSDFQGRIFCKTGTMTTQGCSSLAGYLVGNDGHWYIFSIINSDSPVAESRIFQDRVCKMMMREK